MNTVQGITQYHEVPCPLCGANNPKIRFPATRAASVHNTSQYFCCTNSYLAQHGDIVECQACGMVYNNPQPDPEELLAIYKNVEDPRYLQEKTGREYTFRKSLQQLHTFRQPPGKLFDIGCYTGTFLEVASNAGWDVSGFELSSWAAALARRSGFSKIYEGDLSQIPIEPNSLEVITLWDVIEHLHNPADLLEHASRFLKNGGILALSTHLLDSYPVRIFGRYYPFFMEMHLVHFSRQTLQRMLAEHHFEILGILPHHRIIAATYFLEKLENMVPWGRSLMRPFLQHKWWHGKFVTISASGLANIFAKCVRTQYRDES
jgi:2-polyprenyl-3-methyl-5-hydroxy-6-metoxy-1,4-benzoquinol methylase